MFNEHDLNNIQVLINFAFANGMVQSQDDAKLLFVLEEKAKRALDLIEKPDPLIVEEADGDDSSRSSE